MEHKLIVGAELRDPGELAALNPGMGRRELARLRMLAQLFDEDDAATGYLEPDDEEQR